MVQNTNTVKIIACSVDLRQATLYREDGTSIVIKQGDPRLADIIKRALPEICAHGFAYVDINTPPEHEHYEQYEKKSSGIVRFFRAASDMVNRFFGTKEDDPPALVPTMAGVVPKPSQEQVIEEIMKHSIPASHPDFSKKLPGTTMVAVVEEKQIVPDAHRLDNHIRHAVKTGSTKGVDAFMKRMGVMSTQRNHTARELLHFLSKGDLPLTDTGDIIIYKRLYMKGNNHFVDPHTQLVVQRVGSRVQMDEKLVDPSRRIECSQGLHVGRRDYMGGFSGDAILLAVIRPEDVIAVPHNEPSKMRVCGYHLIGKLDRDSFRAICDNKPFPPGSQGQKLLAWALAGEYPPYDQIVNIGGPKGTEITISSVTPGASDAADAAPPTKTEKAPRPKTAESIDVDRKSETAPVVKPKEVQAMVEKDKAEKPLTRSQQGRALIDLFATAEESKDKAFAELLALKKRTKISWLALGLTDAEINLVERKMKDEKNKA